MRSARIDRKIVIQKPTETSNSANELITTWSTFATVWAKKTDTGGSERFNGAIVAEMTTNFEIRYLSGLNEKMRIVYESENYGIIGIQEIGRRKGQLVKTMKSDHGYNI